MTFQNKNCTDGAYEIYLLLKGSLDAKIWDSLFQVIQQASVGGHTQPTSSVQCKVIEYTVE